MHGDVREEMNLWLDTMSKHQGLRDNPKAAAIEADLIAEAMTEAGATSVSRVRAIFTRLKKKDGLTFWPSSQQIHAAAKALRQEASTSKGKTVSTGGDRSALTFDEQQVLHDHILPTARRWLHIPGLRQHAEQTLEFWGETVESYKEAAE